MAKLVQSAALILFLAVSISVVIADIDIYDALSGIAPAPELGEKIELLEKFIEGIELLSPVGAPIAEIYLPDIAPAPELVELFDAIIETIDEITEEELSPAYAPVGAPL